MELVAIAGELRFSELNMLVRLKSSPLFAESESRRVQLSDAKTY